MNPSNIAGNFPVVCVGGSAGGLDAYIRLLKHLPDDMGVAIVIVNHLRIVATQLHEILPHYTNMPVELITEGLLIRPNRVFIIPAQRDLPWICGLAGGGVRIPRAGDLRDPVSPRGCPHAVRPADPQDLPRGDLRRRPCLEPGLDRR